MANCNCCNARTRAAFMIMIMTKCYQSQPLEHAHARSVGFSQLQVHLSMARYDLLSVQQVLQLWLGLKLGHNGVRRHGVQPDHLQKFVTAQ